ncbi:hypothetical protein FQA39_LY19184 [Lamprigera yunnana]|nr:hypothetical protein FQA39_LY19184 [Lamprigera yunnana]
MQEIDTLVRTQSQHPNAVIHILDSFIREVEDLYEILNAQQIKAEIASKIIIFIGHHNPSVMVKACVHLFKNAVRHDHLKFLVQILTNELLDKTTEPYCEKGGHFAVILEQVLTNVTDKANIHDLKEEKLLQTLNNLLTLLNWENSEQFPLLQSKLIWRAVHANIVYLTKLFGSEKYSIEVHRVMVELIEILQIPSLDSRQSYAIPVQAILNLTVATVKYFFMCCEESAMKQGEPEKLLEQNRKNNKTIALTKNSSALNGGMIGNGRKKSLTSVEYLKETTTSNTEQFIRAIKSCCMYPTNDKNGDISLDSLTSVSLLLVQFVSPDVMYNGLPWPEEEFCKRLFNNTPLLWELLTLVAMHRPTLCYCSVLLRAITATLIHQWNSLGDQAKHSDPLKYFSMLDTTTKVLDIMALGQLLPPPLSEIRNIIPFLNCSEIVQVLRDCIWNYMRDHVPSPALFNCDPSGKYWRDPTLARPPDVYTTTLRIIMQQNIETVGHLYCHMFIKIPSND